MKKKIEESSRSRQWHPSGYYAGLTPVKGGRKEEGLGGKSLRLQCSSEEGLSSLTKAPEQTLPTKYFHTGQKWPDPNASIMRTHLLRLPRKSVSPTQNVRWVLKALIAGSCQLTNPLASDRWVLSWRVMQVIHLHSCALAWPLCQPNSTFTKIVWH